MGFTLHTVQNDAQKQVSTVNRLCLTPKCLCVTRNTGAIHQDDVLLVKNQYDGALIRRWAVGLQMPTAAFDEAAAKCRIEMAQQPACR